MADNLEEWLVDSNETLSLRLGECNIPYGEDDVSSTSPLARSLDDSDALQDAELEATEPFNPTFTYPIFGEKEKIFGYKGLDIKVAPFLSSLTPLADIPTSCPLLPAA